MDPNACLQAVRNAYRALLPLIDAGSADRPDVAELTADLAREIEELDAWLCRGGYVPVAWAGAAR